MAMIPVVGPVVAAIRNAAKRGQSGRDAMQRRDAMHHRSPGRPHATARLRHPVLTDRDALNHAQVAAAPTPVRVVAVRTPAPVAADRTPVPVVPRPAPAARAPIPGPDVRVARSV